jgi:hypothetical protein
MCIQQYQKLNFFIYKKSKNKKQKTAFRISDFRIFYFLYIHKMVGKLVGNRDNKQGPDMNVVRGCMSA